MADIGADVAALAEPLDFASYDNYPLGRADLFFADAPADEFRPYMRTGHPDYTTYCLDQTRGVSAAPFWVMEQQPGPVNWAPSNPRPAPGMVRLWTLEAFAHGADCVSYFRWRQAPFAQEQMHAGLLRPDSSKSTAWPEVAQAIEEAAALRITEQDFGRAPVAIVTTAECYWVGDIERQSEYWNYNSILFACYKALRRWGVSVDFVDMSVDPDDYALVVAPSLPILDAEFVNRCAAADTPIVFGPRSGAKTDEFSIPGDLPPGLLQSLLPVRVLSVETLRPDCAGTLPWRGEDFVSTTWREELDANGLNVVATYEDLAPAIVSDGRVSYVGTLTCDAFLTAFLREQCERAGIETFDFGNDVRIQRRGELVFAFNYSPAERHLALDESIDFVLGSALLEPYGVSVWRS